MPKKSAETKLAEAVNELGFDKAESIFKFMKALNEQVAPSPRKSVVNIVKEAVNVS